MAHTRQVILNVVCTREVHSGMSPRIALRWLIVNRPPLLNLSTSCIFVSRMIGKTQLVIFGLCRRKDVDY